MTKEKYLTRAGVQQWRPVAIERQFQNASNQSVGFCLACGQYADAVEPDARKYTCENCGKENVYGLEELLIMGLAIVTPRSPRTPRHRALRNISKGTR